MRVAIDTKPERLLNLSYVLGGGEGNPHHQLRLNILGMDNCFEVARLCGIRRVVYASSVAVSGLQRHFGERMVNEDDPKSGPYSGAGDHQLRPPAGRTAADRGALRAEVAATSERT
jgi:nucleoside-diphosphate-sugar epimerase